MSDKQIIPFKAFFKYNVHLKIKDLLKEQDFWQIKREIEEAIRYKEPYLLDNLNKYINSETIIEKSFITDLDFNDAKILLGQKIQSDINVDIFKVECRLISKVYLVRNTQKDFYTLDDKDEKGVFNFHLDRHHSDDYILESLD